MAKKETSPEVSSIAGRILRQIQLGKYSDKQYIELRVSEVKELCASVLSQDETKGQK